MRPHRRPSASQPERKRAPTLCAAPLRVPPSPASSGLLPRAAAFVVAATLTLGALVALAGCSRCSSDHAGASAASEPPAAAQPLPKATAQQGTPPPADTPKLRVATDLPIASLEPLAALAAGADGVDIAWVAMKPGLRDVDAYLLVAPEQLARARFAAPTTDDLIAPWARSERWAVVAVAPRVILTRPEAPTDTLRSDGLRQLIEADARPVAWCPTCAGTVRHLGLLARRWGVPQTKAWLARFRKKAKAFRSEAAALDALEQGAVELAWVDYAAVPGSVDRARVVVAESADSGLNLLWPVVLAVAHASPRAADVSAVTQTLLRAPEARRFWATHHMISTADEADDVAPFSELGQRGLMASDPLADWRAGRELLR